MDAGRVEGCPFSACAEELRACTEAVCGFSGGLPPTGRECAIAYQRFLDQGNYFIRPDSELSDLLAGSNYLASGDEHEVRQPPPIWELAGSDQLAGEPYIIKLTYADRYGLRVVYRGDESADCTPLEYFERWQLHCDLFGDNASFLGALETEAGLRTVVSQQFIEGVPASRAEIDQFFRGNNWKPFSWNDKHAYFDEENDVVISDTHKGNLVKMENGVLAPIDLRVQRIEGGIIDAVRQLCL